jgi:hypothetical protein
MAEAERQEQVAAGLPPSRTADMVRAYANAASIYAEVAREAESASADAASSLATAEQTLDRLIAGATGPNRAAPDFAPVRRAVAAVLQKFPGHPRATALDQRLGKAEADEKTRADTDARATRASEEASRSTEEAERIRSSAAARRTAESSAIATLLQSFVQAYGAMDLARVRALHANMPSSVANNLQRTFASYRSMSVQVDARGEPAFGDDALQSARVVWRLTLNIQPNRGSAITSAQSFSFNLVKQGAEWKIASYQASGTN